MKKVIYLIGLHLLVLSTSACTEEIDWDGVYVYEADYGKNAAENSMLVTYTLTIENDKCLIEEIGYQTYENIICHPIKETDSIIITFKSYDNKELENRFGNQIYQVSAPLFTLTRESGGLYTTWKEHLPKEDAGKKGTMFFKVE